MKKRNIYKKITLTLLAITLVSIFSCSKGSRQRNPSTIYIHLSAEPGTLNPITATDAYSSNINGHIYESLVDRDYDTLELIPQLAERWEISPNKLKYRFYLRKGLKWSDGVKFTADDIIYSFKVMKDPKTVSGHLKVYYIDVKNVRKIDTYTVEFTYSKKYFLGLEMCGTIPIIPKHIFDDKTDINTHKNNRFPIGTGPYVFKKWDTGKKVTLVSNENYWGKKPDINKIVFKLVSEQSVALQMLKKGDLDFLPIREIQWIRQTNSIKFKNKFYKLKYLRRSYSYIGWNSRRKFFSDKRVRRALTHLINREDILNKLLFGLGEIVTGNFYIHDKSYNRNIKKLEYNPERGKELLKEAGWIDSDNDGILDKDGKKFKFTFSMSSGSKFAERLGSILKEDLSKVGIEMNINRYEWAVFLGKVHKHDFDAVSLGWSLGYSGDPYQLWHSSQTKKGSNYIGFKNKEADMIIENARTEFNEIKRTKMYHRFHEIIHEEQPYTFLFCTPSLVVVSKRFDNVKVHKRGLNINEWKVKKQ